MRANSFAAVALTCFLSAPIIAGAGWFSPSVEKSQIDGFDFNYQISDAESIGLIQVFDDGDRTYFQFKNPERLKKTPTVFVTRNGRRELAKLEAKSPYLIVSGVGEKFYVQYEKQASMIEHIGPREETEKVAPKPMDGKKSARMQTAQAARAAEPTPIDKAEKTPEKTIGRLVHGTIVNIPFFENSVTLSKKTQDDLATRAQKIDGAMQIVVRGRPSASGDATTANTRALAIKEFLVGNGIDPGRIEVMADDKSKPGKTEGFYLSELVLIEKESSNLGGRAVPVAGTTERVWNINLSDQTIKGVVDRWAKVAGWQPPSWELPVDYPVIMEAKFNGAFEDAMTQLASSLETSDSPIQVLFYADNRAVRIIGTGVKK